MSSQAAQLQQTMSFFKVAGGHSAPQTQKLAKRSTGPRARDPVAEGAGHAGPAVARDTALPAGAAEAHGESQFTRF
jgi:methyl-accepting chemotaxis protein